MFMKRFTRPFRQLQGKLTLSYTLTSVVTFLLVEVIALTVLFVLVSLNASAIVAGNLKQQASQTAPYFVHGSPDREELTSWLHLINPHVSNQVPFIDNPIFLTVLDTQSQPLPSIAPP